MTGTTGTFNTADAVDGDRGLLDRIRAAFEVLRLRADAVDDALADEGAFPHALAIAALAGVAVGVGRAASLPGIVAFGGLQVVASLLLAGAIHLGARLALDAEQDFVRFYRAFGLTYLIFWLSGVPIVYALFGWVLWAWQLAAVVLITERAYRLERVQAALVVGVPVLAGLLVAGLFNGLVALVSLFGGPF